MGITIKEIGDNCELCPLNKGLCHGIVNYGNGPIFPPCSEMDENTDMELYLKEMQAARIRRNEQYKEKQRVEEEKRKKKELQKKRMAFINAYCREEIKKVNDLKKAVNKIKKRVNDMEVDAAIFDVLVECGFPEEASLKHNEKLCTSKTTLSTFEDILKKSKERLSKKRKEAKETEEYKNIK